LCNGDSITININESFDSYAWSNGDNTPYTTLFAHGIYYATVIDSNGCSSVSDSIWISYYPQSTAVVNYSDSTFCQGDSSVIWISDNLSYPIWNNFYTSDSIWVTNSLEYFYTAYDNNNCKVISDTVQLTIFPFVTPSINIPNTPPFCSNEDSLFIYSSHSPVTWNTGATKDTIFVTNNHQYFYNYTDTNTGCSWYSDSIIIQLNTPIPPSFSSIKESYCNDEYINISVENHYEYNSFNWNYNQSNQPVLQVKLDTSTYIYIALKDSNNCKINDSINVVIKDCNVFLNLFPNITNSQISIYSSSPISYLEIINDIGQVVYSYKPTDTQTKNFFYDVRNLEIGYYIFRIKNEEGTSYKKVLIYH